MSLLNEAHTLMKSATIRDLSSIKELIADIQQRIAVNTQDAIQLEVRHDLTRSQKYLEMRKKKKAGAETKMSDKDMDTQAKLQAMELYPYKELKELVRVHREYRQLLSQLIIDLHAQHKRLEVLQ